MASKEATVRMQIGWAPEALALLTEIRDRLPAPPMPGNPAPAIPAGPDLKVAQSLALYTLLTVLDQWIEDAHDNHVGMGHGNEDRGAECWRTFAAADIRDMVNNAARELSISPFPRSAVGKEDSWRAALAGCPGTPHRGHTRSSDPCPLAIRLA